MSVATIGFVGVLVGATVTLFGELLLATYREHRRVRSALKALEYDLVMNRSLVESILESSRGLGLDHESVQNFKQAMSRSLLERRWFDCEPSKELFVSLMETTKGTAESLRVAQRRMPGGVEDTESLRQYVKDLDNSLKLVRAEIERRDFWSVMLDQT